MKSIARSTLAMAAVALSAMAGTASADTGVGVSIGINQPGVYGRIDIGNYPQPELVYSQPVLIAPPPVAYPRRPIYLYVPPEHQRDWRRYCGRYLACGQPVYFVQEQWVRDRYVREHPGWHDRRDDRGPHGRPYDRGHDGRDGHRDRDRDGRGDHGDHGDRGRRPGG